MLFRGHLVAGATISTTVAIVTCMITKTPIVWSIGITAMAFSSSVATSLLPDLDSEASRISKILPIIRILKLFLILFITSKIYGLFTMDVFSTEYTIKLILMTSLSIFILLSLGHRQILHSIWFVVPIIYLCNRYIGFDGWFKCGISIGLIAGICSHLIGDSYTVDGIPLLYPLPIKLKGKYKSGKDDAKICTQILFWSMGIILLAIVLKVIHLI